MVETSSIVVSLVFDVLGLSQAVCIFSSYFVSALTVDPLLSSNVNCMRQTYATRLTSMRVIEDESTKIS